MLSITRDFERYFELVYADTPELVSQCQKLRYKIFCQETGIFDSSDYSDEQESDRYDARSLHGLLRFRQTNTYIATVRIILADVANPESRFPIEHFSILRRNIRDANWRVPRHKLGEISRFSVLKQFRRRRGEAAMPYGISEHWCDEDWNTLKRWYPHVTLGLFRLIVQLSRQQGVEFWYALVEPKLLKVLARCGIYFDIIGPQVYYKGLRQPCVGYMQDVLKGIDNQRPEVLRFITESESPSLNMA